ncbi:hypothetical protein [Candidatus Regiella insecticola]|uniref:hypothetical protein n=1 Tax=Candidatus Regiella insecticola TaxID=138073 RepID=UPI0002FDB9A7|nr:hypothetical protein [Candidatus Regiella insecticola]
MLVNLFGILISERCFYSLDNKNRNRKNNSDYNKKNKLIILYIFFGITFYASNASAAVKESSLKEEEKLIHADRTNWFEPLKKNILTAYPSPTSYIAKLDNQGIINYQNNATSERKELAENDNKQHLYDTFFHATLGKLPLLNIIEYFPYQSLRSLYTDATQVEGHFKYQGKEQLIKSAHLILKDKFLRPPARRKVKKISFLSKRS